MEKATQTDSQAEVETKQKHLHNNRKDKDYKCNYTIHISGEHLIVRQSLIIVWGQNLYKKKNKNLKLPHKKYFIMTQSYFLLAGLI